MIYTLNNIQTAPSYDALKRNGFSDFDVVAYYGTTSSSDRAIMLADIKNGIGYTTPIVKPIAKVEKRGTQMCTGGLYAQVELEFRRLMGTTFEFNGVKYNLLKLGYSFGWNNNKSRYGVHKMRIRRTRFGASECLSKRIELSKYALDNCDKKLEDWVDTILHEIAHGIDASIRGRSNHDGHWVSIAKHIGCSGERCGNHKLNNDAPSKYTIKCTSCGKETKGYKHSKVVAQGRRSCGICKPNVYDKRYALVQIQNY
tara:strand:+ start:39499 stop:40266 length:768 start_codon:yes stop_codon:yes gene_type:complete